MTYDDVVQVQDALEGRSHTTCVLILHKGLDMNALDLRG